MHATGLGQGLNERALLYGGAQALCLHVGSLSRDLGSF